jgi:RNA polymerase sigma factor (sigma-70 family)
MTPRIEPTDAAFSRVAGSASPASKATVFIVDDDSDVRKALSRLVRSIGLLEESFASASEFLERYDASKPGCLVLDIRMPGMNGLELQQALNHRGRGIPIVFITGYGDIPTITQAIRDGAIDVIAKPVDPKELLKRIGEAIQLDLENRLKREKIEEIRRCLNNLTDREREVMSLLAAGHSAKEIAQRLAISSKTVDNHRAKVLEKMLVDNPTQLARKLSQIDSPEH